MIPWKLLDSAPVPDGGQPLVLWQRAEEYAIRLGTLVLMSSLEHGSEEALAELTCRRLADRPAARVLVGGLGMGFTLAAVLRSLGPAARIEVAELIPAVVAWNRGPIAHLAGAPLVDARVAVWEGDVVARIRASRAAYDAILLDVDNGPAGLTRAGNDDLYSAAGLRAAAQALLPGGLLAVWSVGPEPTFTKQLQSAGFAVSQHLVRARGTKGRRHVLWLAARDGGFTGRD